MRALVLGASSFAAGFVVKSLLESGYHCRCISRGQLQPLFFAADGLANREGFEFFRAHLVDDTDLVLKLINEFKPQVIVDFAGQGMVAPSWEYPWQWFDTNVSSKSHIVRSLVNVDWLEQYIRISTPEVYGSSEHPLSTTAAYNPSTPYAISHVAIDQLMLKFAENYGFPVVLPRYANFYGEHQKLYRVVPRALWSAMTGERFFLDGGGLSERAFIHGRDVGASILSLIEKASRGDIFHFSGAERVSIKSLVEQCFRVVGKFNFNETVVVGPDRVGKDQNYHLDSSTSASSLDWRQQISLVEGISRCAQWMRENQPALAECALKYEHSR